MASFVYNKAKTAILNGDIDFGGGDDIRVAMAMTNTTCDTEDDTEFMDGFTTEDWMDGANYVRKNCSETVTENLPGNLAFFDDTTNHTWAALGAGTRQVAGFVIFKFVTNDTDSIPIAWIDTGGFPFAANGGDVTVTWNVAGVISLS
jgi:hypothetical protein